VGGFAPSNQLDDGLVGEKMLGFCAPSSGLSAGSPPCSLMPTGLFLSMVIGCSPQFLSGMSWRA
jgi:hypothetical protein